jgi:hypothetical protein
VKAAEGVPEMGLQDAVRLADTVVSDVDFVLAMMPFRPGQPLRHAGHDANANRAPPALWSGPPIIFEAWATR